MRALLACFVRAQLERSVVSIAHELDIARQARAWMVATSSAVLVPVRELLTPPLRAAGRIRACRTVVEGLAAPTSIPAPIDVDGARAFHGGAAPPDSARSSRATRGP